MASTKSTSNLMLNSGVHISSDMAASKNYLKNNTSNDTSTFSNPQYS